MRVVLIQLIQVAINFGIKLLDGLLQPGFGEVAGPAVDGFELRAVDGDQVAAEEVQLAAEV